MNVKHILNIDIQDEYIKISPDMSIIDLVKEMYSPKLSPEEIELDEIINTTTLVAFIVQNDKVLGYIDRDTILHEIILEGKDAKKLKAKDIMEPPVLRDENTDIFEILNLILEKGLMAIGITQNKKIIGAISVFDAVDISHNLELN